jgi:hypothetical protein
MFNVFTRKLGLNQPELPTSSEEFPPGAVPEPLWAPPRLAHWAYTAWRTLRWGAFHHGTRMHLGMGVSLNSTEQTRSIRRRR